MFTTILKKDKFVNNLVQHRVDLVHMLNLQVSSDSYKGSSSDLMYGFFDPSCDRFLQKGHTLFIALNLFEALLPL